MQVSIGKAPEEGHHFHCAACDGKITTRHVIAETDRKTRHLCNAECYVKWRKKEEKAA